MTNYQKAIALRFSQSGPLTTLPLRETYFAPKVGVLQHCWNGVPIENLHPRHPAWKRESLDIQEQLKRLFCYPTEVARYQNKVFVRGFDDRGTPWSTELGTSPDKIRLEERVKALLRESPMGQTVLRIL